MIVQFPPCILSLLSFLESRCDLEIVKQCEDVDNFGNVEVVLQGQLAQVRIIRDRGEWYVDIGSHQAMDNWYDVALIQEHITRVVGLDVMYVDEQVAFLRANWKKIERMFSGTSLDDVRSDLEQRLHERARRMFGRHYPSID